MNYFNNEWCFSSLSDEEIQNRLDLYNEYIKKIYEKLPFSLKLLAKYINLHDGKLKEVLIVKNDSRLELNGIFGDLQSGYFFLKLKYLHIGNCDFNAFVSNPKQEIEVLSSEVEVMPDGKFSHKLLFSTKKTVNILFKDFQLTIESATSEDYLNHSSLVFKSKDF